MEAIKAIIWLKPIEDGGRQNGISENYPPHLCINDGSHEDGGGPIYMGVRSTEVHTNNSSNWIEPGEVGEVIFALIYFDLGAEIYRLLKAGREFEIREGSRVIGTGCVQSRFVLDE